MSDDRTARLVGYFDYCVSTMSSMLRKKRFKFQVDMLLADMCNVPFVNAILYSKIRLLDGGNFCDHTNRADVVNHHIYWGKVSRFVCRIASCVTTGVLEPCICRISIRKEVKGGRSFQKLGYVDINLSEFAGSGIDGLTRTYLLEGYNPGQQRQDNSLIRVNISMVLLSSDPCFKVPQQWQSTAATSPEQTVPQASQERTVMGSDSASVTSVSSGFESLGRVPVQRPAEVAGATLGPDVGANRPELRHSTAIEATGHCRNASQASQQSQMSDYPSSMSHSRQSSAGSSHLHRPCHGGEGLASMFPTCKGSAVKKAVNPDVNTVPEFDSSRVDAAELITELLKDYHTTTDDDRRGIDSGSRLRLFISTDGGSAAIAGSSENLPGREGKRFRQVVMEPPPPPR
uniref:C2 NT-type domain-containing protein n=1 Tax=Trichuris muris TaxID=70415 RepID=A0A5S6QY23_TRIMR